MMDDEKKQKKLEGLKARAKMSKSSMNGKWSKEKKSVVLLAAVSF